MTNQEVLENCRAGVIALRQLNSQLARVLPTGQPSGVRTQRFIAEPHGTNAPMAAALQLYDGLKAKEEEMAAEVERLTQAAWPIIKAANTPRNMVILNHYYMMGMTDQEIASQQGLTREYICRGRHQALKSLR